jgi:predicted O-methyltransferase YrrM
MTAEATGRARLVPASETLVTPRVENMDETLLAAAKNAVGFMPDDEGLALHAAGLEAASLAPLLEIGTYCGKSAIYLGAAARVRESVLYTVDHHRGSEENQSGWEHHDDRLVDPRTGRMDTLPWFRRTMEDTGLEDVVIAVIGSSPTIAAHWATPLGLVFIDGGHAFDVALADYEGWARFLVPGGLLVFHDVFEDPADGGQAPFQVWTRAADSGDFDPHSTTGSLRVLQRRRPR